LSQYSASLIADDDASLTSVGTATSATEDEVVFEEILLPSLSWGWSDEKNDRVSHGTLLLSGIDVDDEGAVIGHVGANQKSTVITMDATDSLMYQPDKYLKYFKDAEGDDLYDDEHAKTIAFREAVKKLRAVQSIIK